MPPSVIAVRVATLACAAALLGLRAVSVVPSNAPKIKTDAIEYYGAELVTVAPPCRRGLPATEELVARHGYVLIPPFDDRTVIAGHGTVGPEIAADCSQADLVVVPVSGGGLIAGIAAAIRACRPQAKAACLLRSGELPPSRTPVAVLSGGKRRAGRSGAHPQRGLTRRGHRIIDWLGWDPLRARAARAWSSPVHMSGAPE
jgi:Pyridoxal-phosphate dependent enzyme